MSDVGGGDWPGGTIRAQMIWQSSTGLPEDRWVNVFHFCPPAGVTPVTIAACAQKVLDFYNGDHAAGAGIPLVQMMPSPAIDIAASHVRLYDMSDARPRQPTIVPYTGPGAYNGEGFPAEVALCLSHFGDVNIPRNRGRLYLGPFNRDTAAWPDGQCRPSTGLRTSALAAGLFLAEDDTLEWSQVSQATGTPICRRITNLWVDDAWDTQRRRGVSATARLSGVAA